MLDIFANIALTSRKNGAKYVNFERVSCPVPETGLALFLTRFNDSLDGEIIGVHSSLIGNLRVGDIVRVVYPYEDFELSVSVLPLDSRNPSPILPTRLVRDNGDGFYTCMICAQGFPYVDVDPDTLLNQISNHFVYQH